MWAKYSVNREENVAIFSREICFFAVFVIKL